MPGPSYSALESGYVPHTVQEAISPGRGAPESWQSRRCCLPRQHLIISPDTTCQTASVTHACFDRWLIKGLLQATSMPAAAEAGAESGFQQQQGVPSLPSLPKMPTAPSLVGLTLPFPSFILYSPLNMVSCLLLFLTVVVTHWYQCLLRLNALLPDLQLSTFLLSLTMVYHPHSIASANSDTLLCDHQQRKPDYQVLAQGKSAPASEQSFPHPLRGPRRSQQNDNSTDRMVSGQSVNMAGLCEGNELQESLEGPQVEPQPNLANSTRQPAPVSPFFFAKILRNR